MQNATVPPIGLPDSDARTDRISVEAAAPLLGRSAHGMYRDIRENRFPPGVFFRIGRSIRISRSRLEAWIAAGGTAPVRERDTNAAA